MNSTQQSKFEIPIARCTICGEPMPEGESMFKFHGYSGPCPKPPLLEPYQFRVVVENRDLEAKLVSLLQFFHTPIFEGLSEAERSRLRQQARFMDGYSAVLKERIEAF